MEFFGKIFPEKKSGFFLKIVPREKINFQEKLTLGYFWRKKVDFCGKIFLGENEFLGKNNFQREKWIF